MISTYVCDEEIYNALQAGAMAYLVKSVQREELIAAIRKAAAGQRHIPPEVAARLAERVSRSQLSARELDVLRLLVSGRRNREIARALEITEGTVKLHVSSILGKLGVADRTEACHDRAAAWHRPAGSVAETGNLQGICLSTYRHTTLQLVDGFP